MSNAVKTFETTFFNGTSKGCRKIFSHTEVISAVVIPREFRNEIKTHIRNDVNVVYLLLGDVDGEFVAYVGRTRRTGRRPNEHTKKDFWSELIFFFSSHQFTSDQLEYLECLLYMKLKEAGRVKVENRVSPREALPEISAGEQAMFDSFYNQIVTLTDMAGYDILNQEYTLGNTEIAFFCENNRGARAKGYFRENTIFMQPGSVFADVSDSGREYKINERIKELLATGILIKKNGKLKVQREWKANSPSDASRCVLGHQSNGWKDWKDSDNKTLDEYFRS